jgi:hypothetical protein
MEYREEKKLYILLKTGREVKTDSLDK